MDFPFSHEFLTSDFKSRSRTSIAISLLILISLLFLSSWGNVPTEAKVLIPICVFTILIPYLIALHNRKKSGVVLRIEDGVFSLPRFLFPSYRKVIPFESIYSKRTSTFHDHNILRIDYVGGKLFFFDHQFENAKDFEYLTDTIEKNERLNSSFPLPIVSWTLLILISCISLFLLHGNSPTPNLDIVSFGAWEKDLILHGEIDRLISHALIHQNLIHLFVNMFSLFLLGLALEHRVGKLNFLIVFSAGVICASLAGFVSDFFLVIGASGGVYSLLGAYVADRYLNPDPNKERFKSTTNTLILLAVLLESTVSNFFADIAVSFHLTGFAFGALYAYFLSSPAWKTPAQVVFGVSTALITLALLVRLATYNDQYIYDLSLRWALKDDHPIRTELATWGIATSKLSTSEAINLSISTLERAKNSENSVKILSVLYARKGRYFDALYLANTQIYTASSSPTQLARFERAYTAENPIDISQFAEAETIAVDAICDDKEFVRIHTNETDKIPEVCANQEIIYIRAAEKGARNIRYELDPKFMALPL